MSAEETTSDGFACRDGARELLNFYLNGSLSGDEEAAVRSHVENCPSCTAELAEISEIASVIEGRVLENRPIPGGAHRALRGLGLAAALLVAASAALYWHQIRSRGAEVSIAPDPSVARLDLGTGLTRDGSGLPAVELTSASRNVIVTFFPPMRPGALYAVTVRDAAGRTRLAEAPLPALDGMGRAMLSIPAASLEPAGEYVVMLRDAAPHAEARSFIYPFAVRQAGSGD